MKAKLADSWIEIPFEANNTHTHTLHVFPVVPTSHVFPASPVSNLEQDLKALGVRNACVGPNTARKKRFKLLRDLAAIEKSLGVKLTHHQRMDVFNSWYGASKPHLDSKKTRDDYLGAFFAESGKVRVPTGEGNTLKKALERIATVQLPKLPGSCDWPQSWHKLAALHREVARQSPNRTYFLSCRFPSTRDSEITAGYGGSFWCYSSAVLPVGLILSRAMGPRTPVCKQGIRERERRPWI